MNRTRTLILLALMAALIVVFWYGVGTINLGFVNITLSCLPVVLGTLMLGLKCGLALGAVFGTVSFIASLTAPTALVAPLASAGIWNVIILCYAPRLLVPVMAYLVSKLTKRLKKASIPVSAAAGSLTNTVFYLGIMLVLYLICGIENEKLLALIGTTVLVGGLPEAVVNAIICPAVMYALRRAKYIK